MNGHTHIAGGVALATASTLLLGINKPDDLSVLTIGSFLLYISGAGTGATLPDVDTRKSTISCQHKISSFFIRLFLTHRGFTHSLLALTLFATIVYPTGSLLPYGLGTSLALGLITGYASHLLLDAMNPKGIPLFYPFKKTFSFASIKTGGGIECIVFTLLVFTSIGCSYLLIRQYI